MKITDAIALLEKRGYYIRPANVSEKVEQAREAKRDSRLSFCGRRPTKNQKKTQDDFRKENWACLWEGSLQVFSTRELIKFATHLNADLRAYDSEEQESKRRALRKIERREKASDYE